MNLAQLQEQFLRCIHDDETVLPSVWEGSVKRGLDIYRNNYRSALIETLRETFPRTLLWVGDEAFEAAAAHHVIAHPPTSWTLDDAGTGFADTLTQLFANDPEVADLAALEWAMHRAFCAGDAPAMDGPSFQSACAGLTEEDWLDLRLIPQPALQVLAVTSDCIGLWQALADDQDRPEEPEQFADIGHVIVWREGFRPVCRFANNGEATMLRSVIGGDTYNAICARLAESADAEEAAQLAGGCLRVWLDEGLLSGIAK